MSRCQEDGISFACIGGVNVDMKAKIKGEVSLASSNPVSSAKSYGGVARNVAEYLGRLGFGTHLFSVLGDDGEGRRIVEDNASFISFDNTLIQKEKRTGSYTAVLEQSGGMVIGIADMEIYDTISSSFIEERWDVISSCTWIVLDTNFPLQVNIDVINRCNRENKPLCVVPGSVAKVHKLPLDLHGVSLLVVNEEEARRMTGLPLNREIKDLVTRLLETRAQSVIITLGKQGVMYGTSCGQEGHIRAPEVDVIDVTGAGDAFVSGVLFGLSQDMKVDIACRYGMSCSVLALMTNATVPQDLSRKLLVQTYNNYFLGESDGDKCSSTVLGRSAHS